MTFDKPTRPEANTGMNTGLATTTSETEGLGPITIGILKQDAEYPDMYHVH
jgi:hypothetical protein